MPTTPINGLPSPDSTSPNDPPIHFDALNAVLDSRLNSRHTTTTARNGAITSPVDGMQGAVNGYPQVYRAGQWRGMTANVFTTTTVDTAAKADSAQVMSVSIPDPSYPYVVTATAQVFLGTLGAGVSVNGTVRIGTTPINPSTLAQTNSTGGNLTNLLLFTGAEAVSATLTGAQTVNFYINKNAGAVGNGYQLSAGTYNRLTVKVYPV